MAVRKLKPTSAGRRFQTVSDFAEITRTTPEKSLTEGLSKKAGRNNRGRVTSRRSGGGVPARLHAPPRRPRLRDRRGGRRGPPRPRRRSPGGFPAAAARDVRRGERP